LSHGARAELSCGSGGVWARRFYDEPPRRRLLSTTSKESPPPLLRCAAARARAPRQGTLLSNLVALGDDYVAHTQDTTTAAAAAAAAERRAGGGGGSGGDDGGGGGGGGAARDSPEDARVWAALERVGLKPRVQSLAAGLQTAVRAGDFSEVLSSSSFESRSWAWRMCASAPHHGSVIRRMPPPMRMRSGRALGACVRARAEGYTCLRDRRRVSWSL